MCFFEPDHVEESWERAAETGHGLTPAYAMDADPASASASRSASPARPTRYATDADPAPSAFSRSASPARPTRYATDADPAPSAARSASPARLHPAPLSRESHSLRIVQPSFDKSHPVKYIERARERDEKYRVHIGARLIRRNALFDTETVLKHFTDKTRFTKLYQYERDYKKSLNPKRAPISAVESKLDPNRAEEWAKAGLIWVWCGGEFYSHVPKIGRFHHSSMVAGGEVECAGQWIVKQGDLKKINGLSGHYRPSVDHLYRAVLAMEAAFDDDTTVLLWDAGNATWVDMPWLEFKRCPNRSQYSTCKPV